MWHVNFVTICTWNGITNPPPPPFATLTLVTGVINFLLLVCLGKIGRCVRQYLVLLVMTVKACYMCFDMGIYIALVKQTAVKLWTCLEGMDYPCKLMTVLMTCDSWFLACKRFTTKFSWNFSRILASVCVANKEKHTEKKLLLSRSSWVHKGLSSSMAFAWQVPRNIS